MKWLKNLFTTRLQEIVIEEETLADISAMACSAHPKEMLAFLASSKGIRKGLLVIDELQLQAYNASNDSAHVFLSNIPMTTSIVGTVHSHPGGNKRASEADLHFFSKFGFVHAIIGEPYRPQDIRFYNKNGEQINISVRSDPDRTTHQSRQRD